jgi:hypothetical protein
MMIDVVDMLFDDSLKFCRILGNKLLYRVDKLIVDSLIFVLKFFNGEKFFLVIKVK